jgi:Na+-translocating ferredoxin:NAD+ oxidoreductase subunit G
VRNIIRLSITLAVVGIVSAAILTAVNNLTAPVIAEQRLQEYMRSVKEYFPAMTEYAEKELDGNYFDLVYGSGGNLLGVIAKNITQKGYGGTIIYNLILDKDGAITGIRIVSHSETPGIGDIITKPEFQGRFTGKKHDQLDGIDATTGATVSTAAMIGSIRRLAATTAFSFLGLEEEIFDFSAVPDGTYSGTGLGLKEIVVEVTVEGGKITDIKVVDQNETATYFVNSYPAIPDLIIAEQKLEVDTQTGATLSAEGIIEAVRNALQKALDEAGGGE